MKFLFVCTLYLQLICPSYAQYIPEQKTYTWAKIFEKYFLRAGFTIAEKFLQDESLIIYDKFLKNKVDESTTCSQITMARGNSCSQICPENMDILRRNGSNLTQSQENSLSFLNHVKDFEDTMKKQYGFCWGHARFTTQLRYLAFFDDNNKIATTKFHKHSREWRALIIKNLNQIKWNNPVIFPFVGSINELSKLFEPEIKKIVIETWSRNAISIGNFINRFKNETLYSREDFHKIAREVELRIATGQEPEILFNIWGSDEWIHVVLAKKLFYNEYDYTYTIYLDDNKQYNNVSSMLNPSVIILDLKNETITYPHGKVFGAPGTRVGRIELTSSNYQMYNNFLPKLVNFCKKQTGCND